MANNCLVTEFKKEVNNTDLNYDGGIKIHFVRETGSNIRMLDIPGFSSAEIVENTGNCEFTNSDGTAHYGESVTTAQASGGSTIYLTDGECSVVIYSKYNLSAIRLTKVYSGMYISGEEYLGENSVSGLIVSKLPIASKGQNALDGSFDINFKVKELFVIIPSGDTAASIAYTFKYPSNVTEIEGRHLRFNLPNIKECVNLAELYLTDQYKPVFAKTDIAYLKNLTSFSYVKAGAGDNLQFYTSVEEFVKAYVNGPDGGKASCTDFQWKWIPDGVRTFKGNVIVGGDTEASRIGHITWSTSGDTISITFTINGVTDTTTVTK